MRIFVDLDAVLVNFNKGLTDLMGFPVTPDMNIGKRDDIWTKVDEGGADFWASMDWMPDGRQLWDAIKDKNPTVLSAPSRDPSSRVGKKMWVRENLGANVPVILDTDKASHCEPGDILIDDRQKNTRKWTKADGIAILHKNAVDTIKQLEEILSREKVAFKVDYVDDPKKPGRRVGVMRMRGGMPERVEPPLKGSKGRGKYKRDRTDWKRNVESSQRVVQAYLQHEASWNSYLKEVADDYQKDVELLERAYVNARQSLPGQVAPISRDVESKLESLKWGISRVRGGDTSVSNQLESTLQALKRTFERLPPVKAFLDKCAADDGFKFMSHPVVIDPYDAIVQQAYREMGPAGKDIDVIKLEPVCQGDRVAWVSNQDLLGGEKGKERIVHLCLNKIKQDFKRAHGNAYSMGNPVDAQKMKDLVVTYLKDVVLPHEAVHIEQETKGKGQFGSSPEMGAERAEEWSGLEEMGIQKKAGFFPDGYDPEKGEWVGKMQGLRSEGPRRREVPFSFNRLNTANVNYVRRALLGLKDPKATKIWNAIEAGMMGNYDKEQAAELKRIIQSDAADYSLAVGELVNNLLRNVRMGELKATPVHASVSRKFAQSVVMKYASQRTSHGWMKKASDGKKVIILQGISGAGKSTLARELERKYNVKALGSDDFFMKDGKYIFEPDRLQEAHTWNRDRVEEAMKRGDRVVIVDNTNTQAWEMKPYVKLAYTYGYDTEIKEPNWSPNLKDEQGRWNVPFIKKLQKSKWHSREI